MIYNCLSVDRSLEPIHSKFQYCSFIFQTINFVRSSNVGLKFQRFTSLGYSDIEIKKSKFLTSKFEADQYHR